MELDHDLLSRSLDIRDVTDVLLGERSYECESFFLLALFLGKAIQDGGESRAVPLELLFLTVAILPHPAQVGIQEEH